MKLPRINVLEAKKRKALKRHYGDYYQKNLNSFGRKQMQTLVNKGISLSW